MRTRRIVPKLRHLADCRALGFVGLEQFLSGGAWSGLLRHPVAIAASWLFAFVCCVVAHNHMHLPMFRGRFWNGIFQLFLMFGSGQPPTGIITAHNVRHHSHANTELDFVRVSLVRSRWNFLNLVVFPFISVMAMLREKPGDLRAWKKSRPSLYRQALLERVVFYGVLFTLLMLDWRASLVFLVLPWIGAQLCLIGMNLLQHQDCDEASEFDHSRNVTGRVLNWMLLNNGFHTAHHLRPSLHWSRLPDFHRKQVAPWINPALDHSSFTGLLVERLRRQPDSHVR